MAWKQLIKPKVDVNYTGGWCQRAVRQAFNVPALYGTASAAWSGEKSKHTDRPPLGIEVPIYLDLQGEPADHVAIHLADGQVASSSQAGVHKELFIHPSIDALIKYYSSAYKTKYLGWGEHVSNTRVVEYQVDPAPKPEPTPPNPNPAPKPTPAAPKVGDHVTTTATHDVQNGKPLNLKLINDGHSYFGEVNSKGNAVLRHDSNHIVRAAVPVNSLHKI